MPEAVLGAQKQQTTMEHHEENQANQQQQQSDNNEIEVRLLLLERSSGGIIGKGGENISRLRTQYNVYVQMPSTRTVDRAFTVKGSMQSCLNVVRELLMFATQGPYSTNQSCAVELNLLVQTSMIGSILGKGGERIREIREATNAKVKVYEECLPCSNERVIAIGGEENEQVLIALTTILNIIKEIPARSRARYYDPANKSSDFSSYGLCSNPWSKSDSGSPFLQLQSVLNITAPNDVCGAIIGKGGSRIREIRHASGATINFSEAEEAGESSDRVITISGSQQQVQIAQQLITQQCARNYGT